MESLGDAQMKKTWICLFVFVLCFLVARPTLAIEAKTFSGRVISVTDERIIVRSGKRTLEFERSAAVSTPISPGDDVTVRYDLSAKEISLKQKPKHQAGQAAPKMKSLDDRAYYGA
jgi:hypothetical protein